MIDHLLNEEEHCLECGMAPGYGYQPWRGLNCETCLKAKEESDIEREIDEAIENREERK